MSGASGGAEWNDSGLVEPSIEIDGNVRWVESNWKIYFYSLVRLVLPNTEMLISRPFTGLYKIRLLLWDCMRTKNVRN